MTTSRQAAPPVAVPVRPETLHAAIERFVSRGGTPASRASVRRFIDNAAALPLDLSEIWAAPSGTGGGDFDEVCLVARASGRTAMLFLSPELGSPGVRGHDRRHRAGGPNDDALALSHLARVAVIEGACSSAARARGAESPCALAQTLLEPAERAACRAFLDAGFTRLGDLAYLRRAVPAGGEPPGGALPGGARTVRYADLAAGARERLLAETLERTYAGTLDCPELCGLRDPGDVVASHLAVGEHDPRLWWLVFLDDQPMGCVLLSPNPAQQSIELVYLGLAPQLRGRGVAGALLGAALADLCGRAERWVCCAVDTRNTPAMKLYRSGGFVPFATRRPLVRSLVSPRI